MKLPSGREISVDSLANVAEMLAIESFYLESTSDAEEEVMDNLRDECFSLSGTESPFSDNDIAAIIGAVRPAAEKLGSGLAAVMDERRLQAKEMIEKELGTWPPTAFKDARDSRPVAVGDLVAAQWYPDETYYIGVVNDELDVENFGGFGSVEAAYHVIRLMDANEWTKLYDSMNQAPFMLLAEKFPMIKTGDFGPEETLAYDEALKKAVLTWLHWNYPRK